MYSDVVVFDETRNMSSFRNGNFLLNLLFIGLIFANVHLLMKMNLWEISPKKFVDFNVVSKRIRSIPLSSSRDCMLRSVGFPDGILVAVPLYAHIYKIEIFCYREPGGIGDSNEFGTREVLLIFYNAAYIGCVFAGEI